jgi:hypothetical protein
MGKVLKPSTGERFHQRSVECTMSPLPLRWVKYTAVPMIQDGASLVPPQPKQRKVSPQVVPAPHTTGGESGASAARPCKQGKANTLLARMTPGSSAAPPDLLWNTLDDRPSPRCENCMVKGHLDCWTTGVKLTCLACHTGKTKCSYSAA